MNITTRYNKIGATLLIAALASSNAFGAGSWKGIQFGGFASQGYLVNSGDNDYLGETSEGTFDFREYAASASYATGEWRIGAQVFGQKLGVYGNDELALDWASIDYQPAQWLGFRAGRVKTPRGLYNEALDVDSIRPFVLMPQSVYDARLRDFNASFDGVMMFGNVAIGDSNSFDYKVYHGDIPMKVESGANDYFNQDLPYPNTSIGMDSATGGSIFWNTGLDGLRLGYSASVFDNFNMDREVSFGPGFPPVILNRGTQDYKRQLLSAEYSVGDWVFAGEMGRETALYDITDADGNSFDIFLDFEVEYAYASVARRLSEKFEVGAYYSYSMETQVSSDGVTAFPDYEQADLSVSVRYDYNYNLLFKLEAHYMDGSGKIFSTPSYLQPVEDRDGSWMLFAAKTTYTF
ncbi:hypothetical protein VDG1235_4808 [Verrucomicrobiia bacterium DG1235]|nr:hypothetical protein VDG1235_4808 [Verrucomicrobiae bacterium DG1235]